MIQTRLILIDGIAGTGKTTFSRKLHSVINRVSGNSILYHEFATHHPIHEWEIDDYPTWEKKTIENWQTLGHALIQKQSIGIVESSLFQGTVGDLLERNLPDETIHEYALQVPALIQAVSPILIYLVPDDARPHIEQTYANRTGGWQTKIDSFIQQTALGRARNIAGLDGYLTFIKELKRLSDHLFQAYEMKKFRLKISGYAWETYETHILDFLEIPAGIRGKSSIRPRKQ